MKSSANVSSNMSQVIDGFRLFFGMREMPFSLVPNTEYFVNLRPYSECFNMLHFAIMAGEGFIKVTGEVGTGKTLLCRRLLNSLDPEDYVTAYIPTPQMSPLELKRALAKELSCEHVDTIADDMLIDKLIHRLMDIAQTGKRVLLIIDEAQALPESSLEEIRLLTNLETEQKKLLQIILFGQPELNVILGQHKFRQLRQRIAYSCFLPKLDRKSIQQYVNHRMTIAGYNGEPVFERGALSLLHKATHGTPRLVNIICAKALLIAFSLGQKTVNKAMIKTALRDTEAIQYRPSWFFWLTT